MRLEEPLETLLGQEGLARLGAIMAVDGEGVLRGIVTVDPVRRALQRGAGPEELAQLRRHAVAVVAQPAS